MRRMPAPGESSHVGRRSGEARQVDGFRALFIFRRKVLIAPIIAETCAMAPAESAPPVRNKVMNRLLAFLSSAALVGAAAAADPLVWPQFRGPNGSGVADGQKPPTDIGPDKNVKW